MEMFEKLEKLTQAAGEEQGLPDFLAARIHRIVAERESFSGLETEIEGLARMVELYDTYGQTGYMGMGVNNVILEKALQRLESMGGAPR